MGPVRQLKNDLQKLRRDGLGEILELPGRLWRILRMFFLSAIEFRRALCFERAANLSFTTLLSLIPLAVLFFSFAAVLAGGDRIVEWVKETLLPFVAPEVHGQIEGWLDANISTDALKQGKAGLVNTVAIVGLLMASVGLFTASERYANIIWEVKKRRSYFQRAVAFWCILTTSPFLVALSISMGEWLVPQGGTLDQLLEQSAILRFIYDLLVPIVVSFVGFVLVYMFLPNTKVRLRSAAVGGLFAAVVWTVSKRGFFLYVSSRSAVGSFYGGLATIPLLLVWIYLSWAVVLAGCVLAYTHQHFDDLEARRKEAKRRKKTSRLRTGFVLLEKAVLAFREGGSPVRRSDIQTVLEVSGQEVEDCGDILVDMGVLVTVEADEPAWWPGRPPEDIKLLPVVTRLLAEDFHDLDAQSSAGPPLLDTAWQSFIEHLESHTAADLAPDGKSERERPHEN